MHFINPYLDQYDIEYIKLFLSEKISYDKKGLFDIEETFSKMGNEIELTKEYNEKIGMNSNSALPMLWKLYNKILWSGLGKKLQKDQLQYYVDTVCVDEKVEDLKAMTGRKFLVNDAFFTGYMFLVKEFCTNKNFEELVRKPYFSKRVIEEDNAEEYFKEIFRIYITIWSLHFYDVLRFNQYTMDDALEIVTSTMDEEIPETPELLFDSSPQKNMLNRLKQITKLKLNESPSKTIQEKILDSEKKLIMLNEKINDIVEMQWKKLDKSITNWSNSRQIHQIPAFQAESIADFIKKNIGEYLEIMNSLPYKGKHEKFELELVLGMLGFTADILRKHCKSCICGNDGYPNQSEPCKSCEDHVNCDHYRKMLNVFNDEILLEFTNEDPEIKQNLDKYLLYEKLNKEKLKYKVAEKNYKKIVKECLEEGYKENELLNWGASLEKKSSYERCNELQSSLHEYNEYKECESLNSIITRMRGDKTDFNSTPVPLISLKKALKLSDKQKNDLAEIIREIEDSKKY